MTYPIFTYEFDIYFIESSKVQSARLEVWTRDDDNNSTHLINGVNFLEIFSIEGQ